MLMITQREGEVLVVGDDVRIEFKRVRGGSVRLAIDAPRSVEIRRLPAPEERRAADAPPDDDR